MASQPSTSSCTIITYGKRALKLIAADKQDPPINIPSVEIVIVPWNKDWGNRGGRSTRRDQPSAGRHTSCIERRNLN
eukprot:scaffold293294_cov14-Prasinocladus_malaysianus.AAC.1